MAAKLSLNCGVNCEWDLGQTKMESVDQQTRILRDAISQRQMSIGRLVKDQHSPESSSQ
jgi:hypothetical protein